MNVVTVIAKNTFREIIRDRILYGLLVFTLLLMGLSIALGQLSFQEQMRVSLNFGFTGIHLSAVILSIFVGSSLVYKEIEKQTVLTLLARPITRGQFILGKFLGLVGVIFVILVALGIILGLVTIGIGFEPELSFLLALLGIFLESLVLLSLAVFFGTFARPSMTVVFTLSFFMIGHWLNDLKFFAQKSPSVFFKYLGQALSQALPNLESFNWRAHPVYNEVLPTDQLVGGVLIALGWVLFFLLLTRYVFGKRDFV